MSERTKKILVICGFVLFVCVMGYLIYRVFFKPEILAPQRAEEGVPTGGLPQAEVGIAPAETPISPEGLPSTEGVPGVVSPVLPPVAGAPGKTVQLTQSFMQSMGPSVSKDGVRMYSPDDNLFYKVTSDGSLVPLSQQRFYNVENVTWGNVSDKAVIQYPDESKILYDFAKDKQYTLPKHWNDFDFSTQDDKIVAKSLGFNETNRFLVVSNPDGTEARAVTDLGKNQDKVQVSWSPNNQVVGFSHTGEPLGIDREQVLLLGQNNENFKGLVVEGRGFVPNWSPSGNTLLYSVYRSVDNYIPELWVSGASGDQVNASRRRLGIQTWADKCAWQDEKTLVCAVPEKLDVGAGLQRELFANVPDRIVRIQMDTGRVVDLGQPDGKPALQQIVLSADGQYLFYTDRTFGRLSRFSLAP